MNHHDEQGGEAEMNEKSNAEENVHKTDAKDGSGQAAATQRQQQSPDEEGRIIDEKLKSQDMDEPSTDPNEEWSPGSSQSGK